MKDAEVKSQLFATHSFLQELTGKPMRPDRNERLMGSDSDLDGIPVRAVELVGKPGAVVLAHPWLLHAISQNTADRPRLMRASRVYRRDFYEEHMKGSVAKAGAHALRSGGPDLEAAPEVGAARLIHQEGAIRPPVPNDFSHAAARRSACRQVTVNSERTGSRQCSTEETWPSAQDFVRDLRQ